MATCVSFIIFAFPFEVVWGLDHERVEDSSVRMMVPNCSGEEGIQSKLSPGYFLGLSTHLILLYRTWNRGPKW